MTRSDALRSLRAAFSDAGLDNPALDSRILLLAALGIAPAELVSNPSIPLSEGQSARLGDYARRRLSHEPVARILGEREFWGMPFGLSPETLVPRPDTETVVETALDLLGDRRRALKIVDLGTGSGCLLVALLHELPGAIGIGIDRSAEAARMARLNAHRNGVGERSLFVVSDWGSAIEGGVDLIVSNPPYIATRAIDDLAPEVREFDPRLALDGGEDGLDAYRIILAQAYRLLAPEGHLVIEIGHDQQGALGLLAPNQGFKVIRCTADLGGQPRSLALKRT